LRALASNLDERLQGANRLTVVMRPERSEAEWECNVARA